MPVTFYSCKLKNNDLERTFFSLELLSFYNLVERYKKYLCNSFTIYVDDMSLVHLLHDAKSMGRYDNIFHRLLEHKFEIVTDYISRM